MNERISTFKKSRLDETVFTRTKLELVPKLLEMLLVDNLIDKPKQALTELDKKEIQC